MKAPIHFCRGDIIRTNPADGFYGVAIVLDDGKKVELAPNKWSYPLCHIAVTPCRFDFEFDRQEIINLRLEPLIFQEFQIINNKRTFLRNKICVDIYTNRNKGKLPVIGNINPESVYKEELLWEPQFDRFHFRGDPTSDLGYEAYCDWRRKQPGVSSPLR